MLAGRMAEWLTPDVPPAGADGPVALLERRVAALLGKPAALFFPTGTMAQQVALRIHAERRGRPTFLAHPTNHLELWEQHGYSSVHGLRFLPVGDPHRLLRLADLDGLRQLGEPPATLLLELPQREIGGLLPTWDELTAQIGWARERDVATHLDGARLWEAQPAYDRPHAEIAALFDTVYVSLYKGLSGIRGAVLAGTADVIAEAAVWRRRLGGDIPEAWPLAVAALIGLDERLDRMPAYRDHAIALARAIVADGVAAVHPDPPQTPLFHLHLPIPVEAATRAGQELVDEHGVQVLSYVHSQPLPDRCAIELSIGEHAMEFTPDEVAALIRELVDRARS